MSDTVELGEINVGNQAVANIEEMMAAGLPDDYWQKLVQYTEDERGEPALGEFERLQSMNLTHLLNVLARIKGDIERTHTTSPEQMALLRQVLHQYSKYCTRTVTFFFFFLIFCISGTS